MRENPLKNFKKAALRTALVSTLGATALASGENALAQTTNKDDFNKHNIGVSQTNANEKKNIPPEIKINPQFEGGVVEPSFDRFSQAHSEESIVGKEIIAVDYPPGSLTNFLANGNEIPAGQAVGLALKLLNDPKHLQLERNKMNCNRIFMKDHVNNDIKILNFLKKMINLMPK